MWCWRPPQIMPHQDNHKTVAPPYVIDTSDVVLAALLKISLSGLLCLEFLTTFMFHQEMMVRTLVWPDSLAVEFLNSYVDKKRVPHLPRKPIRPTQISTSKSFC